MAPWPDRMNARSGRVLWVSRDRVQGTEMGLDVPSLSLCPVGAYGLEWETDSD